MFASTISRVSGKVLRIIPQRQVATMGKHFAQLRREEAAKKAAEKAEKLAAYAKKLEEMQPPVIAPEIIEAQKRTQYVSACDVNNPLNKAKAIEAAANATDVTFANRELTQIIDIAATAAPESYKGALKVFQKIITTDYVPERNAIRNLLRVLENAQQWKAANILFEFLKDLYPLKEYDEVGMRKPAVVLTKPIPDFAALAEIPASENTFEELVKFIETRSAHGRLPTFDTYHVYMHQLIARKKYDEAVKLAFTLFKRADIQETDEVPAPFSPIYMHYVYRGGNTQFSIDYPLYYQLAAYLESKNNFSAAMQIYIYMRALNRGIDVTPIREITSAGKTRDFVDIHTFKKKQIGFMIKHWLKELRLRRGYAAAVSAKVAGAAEGKTYMKTEHKDAALLDTSPLINTNVETMVMLCDRSYNNKDVREEKAPEDLLAPYVVEEFAKYGIKAQISKASEYSSNARIVKALITKEEAVDDVHRELTLVIPAEEFVKYSEKALAELKAAF